MNEASVYGQIVRFIRRLYNEEELEIPLHQPVFQGNEEKYVMDALRSTFVSSIGKYVEQLEQMLCEITGCRYAIAVVNGTAALHAALLTAGVSAGDEVITQPLSFVATSNAIRYCNANPVFLDVDPDTLGLSHEAVTGFLERYGRVHNRECFNSMTGSRISACLPVHTFGHPCKIDRIIDTCERYYVKVIEDAAEAIGSTYMGKHAGTFGMAGVYSFNGNKTVTSGGGGIILTDDKEFNLRAKHITTTAKIAHSYEYVHDEVGYNYRMPNLNAALACAQLEQLQLFVEKKREIACRYADFFKTIGIPFFIESKHTNANYWLNTIFFQNHKARDAFISLANKSGVLARPAWRLLCDLPMYDTCQTDDLETAISVEHRIANIPSGIIL